MSTSPVPVVPIEEAAPVEVVRSRPPVEEIVAWIVIAAAMFFVLFLHLVPAVVAGLALYLILDRLALSFRKRLGSASRTVAMLLVTVIGTSIIVGAIALSVSFMRHHAGNVPAMMTKMAEILKSTRAWLGGIGEELIPEVLVDAENLKAGVVDWLTEHAEAVKHAGSWFSMGVVHAIMGVLLAVLVFFRHVMKHGETRGPLAHCLVEKVDRFAHAFSRIATAQIKISAVNTVLTGVYLLLILPLFGRHIPFASTIVLVTFICGLLPVVGNLISNTVIVVLSLGVSVGTSIASLVFLVLIHKLEYLINSRIVGGETDSQAWEILMAIIIGESAFGVSGVVMAPIIYAFVKRELRERGLV
jgi:predicted PurR-regulated permease PerM